MLPWNNSSCDAAVSIPTPSAHIHSGARLMAAVKRATRQTINAVICTMRAVIFLITKLNFAEINPHMA